MAGIVPLIILILAGWLIWKKILSKDPWIRTQLKLDEIEAEKDLAKEVSKVDPKKVKENKKKLQKFNS